MNIIKWGVIALLCVSCCTKQPDGSQKCEYTLNSCSNEVNGYAIFSNGASAHAGATVVVEWSDDSFASHTYSGTTVTNSQGMLVVPFHFDATYTCGSIPKIQIRAFESTDGSNVWVSGNTVGRYDGTPTSNASYRTVSATSATEILIYLDHQGAQ